MITQRTIRVRAADTLIIGPGVTVYFGGPYRFEIRGLLLAQGTQEDSIRFTTDTLTNTARWRGIRFLAAPNGCLMQYCVVENGYGAAPGDDRYGGGIECQNCSPHFENCSIRRCNAILDGGGVYCRDGGAPIFDRCEISDCYSRFGDGGGLFSRMASPRLTQCTVRGNRTPNNGGGIGVIVAPDTVKVTHCLIESNSAGTGGGLFLQGRRAPTAVQGSLIRGNSAQRGGGVFDTSGVVRFDRCQIDSNTANVGGGLYGTRARSVAVNCLWHSNEADSGGAVFDVEGQVSLDYCTLAHNRSQTAAVFGYTDTTDCATSIVAFTEEGAGIQLLSPYSVGIRGCDFFGNEAANFAGHVPSDIGRLTRVNIWRDSCDANFNLLIDPRFVNMANGNYRLSDSSHCLAAAGAWYDVNTDEDLDSLSRPWPATSRPDIGAYESRSNSPVVLLNGNVRGTFGPGVFYIGADIRVASQDTLTLLPGTRLMFITECTITINGLLRAIGTAQDSVVFASDTSHDYAYSWGGLILSSAATGCSLEYCRFTHGIPTGLRISHCDPVIEYCTIEGSADWRSTAGAVLCTSAQPRFRQCLFRHNFGTYSGGIYALSSHIVAEECTFFGNRSNATPYDGAGICLQASSAEVSRCTFQENIGGGGGAIGMTNTSTGTFTDCVFLHNGAQYGGAVYCRGTHPLFDRCMFTHNNSYRGGAIGLENSQARIVRCTLVADTSMYGNGEIHCVRSSPTITSCIMSYGIGSGIRFEHSPDAIIRNCDVYGNTLGGFASTYTMDDMPSGLGVLSGVNLRRDSCDGFFNISTDPLFADTAAADYHLTELSRCIDGGDAGLPPDPDSTLADIGAFSFAHATHPPALFYLIAPENDSTMTRDSSVVFIWHSSADPDVGDTLTYRLFMSSADTSLVFPITMDTSWTIEIADLPFPDGHAARWWVEAQSRIPHESTFSDTLSFRLAGPSGISDTDLLPRVFALHEAFPNPFNPACRLEFDLPRLSKIRLSVFDVQGRLVTVLADQSMEAGRHMVLFDGARLPSGVYFARAEARDWSQTRKLVLLK
jgi:hypothetical protein